MVKNRKYRFKIDELKIFEYIREHNIPTLYDFLYSAELTYDVIVRARYKGYVSLETAWLLAERMGCMIEDIIIAERNESNAI